VTQSIQRDGDRRWLMQIAGRVFQQWRPGYV